MTDLNIPMESPENIYRKKVALPGPQAEDEDGASDLRLAQANRRTGLRHHQISDGLSAVLCARLAESHGRVDAGLPRVECEAHGRIAPQFR